MPTDTLAGYTARIAEYAAMNGIECDRFKRRKIAQMLFARGERMHDTDLERIFMHADVVPPAAFRHIERGYCHHCN